MELIKISGFRADPLTIVKHISLTRFRAECDSRYFYVPNHQSPSSPTKTSYDDFAREGYDSPKFK